MTRVWLGLGSNLGDRDSHLKRAVSSLRGVLKSVLISPVYETAPQDFVDQPSFLNMVVCGETHLSPPQLFERIVDIEYRGGRNRNNTVPKGPRVIDIDLLHWGCLVAAWSFPGHVLILPHPAISRRRFVLTPVLDIDPQLRDPADGVAYAVKIQSLSEQELWPYASS